LAHGGANRFKRAAFAVVKDVIEKGRVVLTNEAENETSYYIAAPVLIDNADDIVVVLVHKDMNTQRMYLHMVGTKESLLNRRVSGAPKERSGSSSSGVDVSTLLSEVLQVNPESVTTSIDANGEPVVSSAGAVSGGVTPGVPATSAASPASATPSSGLGMSELMEILSGLVEIQRETTGKSGFPHQHWGFMSWFERGVSEETAGGKKATAERVPMMEESLVETARSFVRRVQHAAVMDRVIRMAKEAESVTGPLITPVESPATAKSVLKKGKARAGKLVGERKLYPDRPFHPEHNPYLSGGSRVDNGLAAFFAGVIESDDGRTIYVPQLDSVGGKVTWYAVPAELANAVASLSMKVGKFSESVIGVWMKKYFDPKIERSLLAADLMQSLLSAMARFFRAGATAMNPRFGLVTNVVRDFRTLSANTRMAQDGTLKDKGKDFLKVWGNWFGFMGYGFLRAVSGKDLRALKLGKFADIYEVFDRLGMRLSGSLTQDSAPLKAALRDVRRGGEWKEMPHIADLWEFMLGVLQFPESAARMAEMKSVAAKMGWDPSQYMTPAVAAKLAQAGKSVTVDFTRAGRWAQIWNSIVPFFNSSIQGKVSAYEAFRRNPAGWLFTRALPIVVLTALNWWRNRDEDWYKEMGEIERSNYDYIPLGDGNVLRIPRSFEVDIIFAGFTEAMLNVIWDSDPDRLADWFGNAFEQFSSVLSTESTTLFVSENAIPPLVREAMAQWKNYDSFYKKPIVGKTYEENEPKDQYSPYTTNLSIQLGKTFGISPMRIDHAIKGTTAGVGDWVVGLGGRGSEIGLPAREKEPSDALGGLGSGLFRRGGDEPNGGRTIRRLYRRVEELSAAYEDSPDRHTKTMLTGAWDALRAIQALQYQHSHTPSRAERKAITEEQLEIAHEAHDSIDAGRFSPQSRRIWKVIFNENLASLPSPKTDTAK
jgi:hypothetical protein